MRRWRKILHLDIRDEDEDEAEDDAFGIHRLGYFVRLIKIIFRLLPCCRSGLMHQPVQLANRGKGAD